MKFGRLTVFATVAGLGLVLHPMLSFAQSPSIYQAVAGDENAKTPEISTEQMRRFVAEGGAVLIDSRSRAEFDAGHIPGAVALDVPPDEQVAAVDRLAAGDKSKTLVVYCNGPFCQASRRLGEKLASAGFSDVRRYQLGIPIWRALGGPTEIELSGIKRVFNIDRTAVFVDARSADDFAKGSLPGTRSVPVEDVVSGKVKNFDLPEDDFNRRVILFGADAAQAKQLAEILSKRPWHNVAYFSGTFAELAATLNVP
ncbi:MAG: rhodanese-like domain-containing protein [Alphaproteobacteria bacterium]